VHFRQALIACAAIASFSCGDSAPTIPTPVAPAPTPVIRLSGTVVDYRTSQPVADVPMTWRGRSDTSSGFLTPVQAVSDASGRFEIVLPVADSFSFELMLKEPFTDGPSIRRLSESGTVRVPGKRLDTNLLFNAGPCSMRYGYVFDALTREPIAGARVARAGTATTDANGYYQIDIGCDPRARDWGIGTTIIGVQHPAYQSASELDGRREFTGYAGIRRVDFALRPLASP
jgi:hypothetical protein